MNNKIIYNQIKFGFFVFTVRKWVDTIVRCFEFASTRTIHFNLLCDFYPESWLLKDWQKFYWHSTEHNRNGSVDRFASKRHAITMNNWHFTRVSDSYFSCINSPANRKTEAAMLHGNWSLKTMHTCGPPYAGAFCI